MLTLTGLVRTFVLFVIDVETRRVQICGIVRQPHGAWMKRVARNLTDGVDGFLAGKRFLIHDRDPLFTQEFRDILRAAGIRSLKLPAHSPDLNAFAVGQAGHRRASNLIRYSGDDSRPVADAPSH